MKPATSHELPIRQRGAVVLIVALVLIALPLPAFAKASQQKTFATAESAVEALVSAARSDRTADLVRLLGPEGGPLVTSGDPVADKRARRQFVAEYDQKHEIEKDGDARAILVIGDEQWPLPIPIARADGAWHFDAAAGQREILRRRVGRNELSAIEVCRAYVDAQHDYASKDRNGDGILEYAQKFVSTKGKQDGLYWEVKPGELESPVGPLMASARAEGYERQPYHGYYYKILKAQGKDAPGGAYSYLAGKRMIGGFALVAFPAQYGVSGVMTFIVNQDGVVYQKNLGRDTARIARTMTVFNPDPSWVNQ